MTVDAVAAPVALHRALPPEEAARGDFYALLARLLRDAPDGALLASLAAAGPIPSDGDAALAKAWQDLVYAASAMDADAAAEEYENVFIGMGKSEVSLYAGFYGVAPSVDHPRVRLQADLAALGLEKRAEVTEPEDHYAGLFDVMRVLVAGGLGRSPASLAEQKRFYMTHLEPGIARCFAAMASAPHANFYRHVAAVGRAFAAIESESFQLESR